VAINAGKLVIRLLETQGAEMIFGIPGGHTLALNDALIESSIRFVATRHEYGAACAASAWGRLRRTPGICLATCGPGATNLATGLGAALRDSSPVIALTVNNTLRDMSWEDAQEADAVSVLRPLVKWAKLVRHPDEISASIAEAYRVAINGRPGPVLLDFARDVLEKGQAEIAGPGSVRIGTPERFHPESTKVERLLELIVGADRPVFWAGNGVRASDAGSALLGCADRLGVPVITTFNGIGTVPTDHPLVFGARSRVGTKLSNALLAEADLVVAIGTGMGGVTTSRWALKLPRLVQIDIEPTRIGRRYPIELGVGADAKVTLAALEKLATAVRDTRRGAREPWLQRCGSLRKEWTSAVAHTEYDSLSPIKPQTLMRQLARIGTANTVWCVDASNCGIWTHMLPMTSGMEYMRPVNFSNMGYALPAGIGAKLAEPMRDVVVLAGDGAIAMSLAELETAARLKLKLTIVVMNDCGYGNIRQEQLFKYGPRYNGVDLGDIKFHEVAKACGGDGVRVARPEQFADAFAGAAQCRGPFVIDVIIDPNESVWNHPL
jgi:acetolactate synthase I/II/III large subunit